MYRGRANDGSTLLEQVDVDVESNASVFTRMPKINMANAQSNMVGNVNGTTSMASGTFAGNSSATATAMAPHPEQNIVLPPRETNFAVPNGKTLTLPTGQLIEFIKSEPHQLTYRIAQAN